MPESYVALRTEIACLGVEHENRQDIYRAKMAVLGGMNFISADNINKANSNRTDNFNNFIEDCYPYIEMETKKPDKEEGASLESMIADYKRIFAAAQPDSGQ